MGTELFSVQRAKHRLKEFQFARHRTFRNFGVARCVLVSAFTGLFIGGLCIGVLLSVIVPVCYAEGPKVDSSSPNSLTNLSSRRDALSAQLKAKSGSTVSGRVLFEPKDGGVKVSGQVTNLPPGPHGFHIHETGDCSAEDASSAGGHFNPLHQQHGGRRDDERHIGDFGNIVADHGDQESQFSFYIDRLQLRGRNGIEGKAIVIHENKDDLKSQPSGNAGKRIACGVIKRAA